LLISIQVTAIADEDLYLEGEYDRIARVHKSEITEFKMKYTTPFSKMFEQYYLRHYLAPGSMAFFFTEKLRHDQCPAEVRNVYSLQILHLKISNHSWVFLSEFQ
jgi:hypothetical protein